MKKTIQVLGAFVLALNLLALSFTATAQVDESVPGGGLDCKWSQIDCGGGKTQEGCLVDGDGNACTCGTVTRPC